MRRSGKKFQDPAKKQKTSKHIKNSSEKDRAARETDKERLKQLSDARKDNLKVYVSNFSNRAINILVVKFQKVLIFLSNTLAIFFIFYGTTEANRQNKHMLLLFLKKNCSFLGEIRHSGQFGAKNGRFL